MRLELIFLLFSATIVHAQSANFKEIRLRAKPAYFNPKDKYATIIYPVISTKNSKIDKLINAEIRNQILDADETYPGVLKILNSLSNDGLTDLLYEVTFNKNFILSFNIYTQYSGGAHLVDNTTYFNFDLSTGKKITVSDLFIQDKMDSFKQQILSNRQDSLKKYKMEELDLLRQKEVDSATYEFAIEQIENNYVSFDDFERFIITKSSIEFIDKVQFPRIIRSQEPSYHLKYSLKTLATFLNLKYRKPLLK
jgi:Deacetylase PdaC